MRLLDLFCGAGGAAMGYHRAGFEVVGVDHNPQPNYPFEFCLEDALEFSVEGFDIIHASPPCQAFCGLSRGNHPNLIEPVREKLKRSGLPYVIENIVGSPLKDPFMLCGSMFGLNVRRHRLFETNFFILVPQCNHGSQKEIRGYYGKQGKTLRSLNIQRKYRRPLLRGTIERAPDDMGIDWMKAWNELREAIPPAYTEYIGSNFKQPED